MRLFIAILGIVALSGSAVAQTPPECKKCYLENTPKGVVQICVPCPKK
jgi:hypothetical protein